MTPGVFFIYNGTYCMKPETTAQGKMKPSPATTEQNSSYNGLG
jgi:hypothetical protein